MDGLAFGPGWIFGNRDGVSWGETSGWNRKVRRNGDREAFGGNDPVSQDGSQVYPPGCIWEQVGLAS